MNSNRAFDSPRPVVLAEMADFVDLARLSIGGNYASIEVQVSLSKTVPAEWLASSEFRAFRSALAGLPRCQARFEAVDQPLHTIHIKIQR